MAGTCGQRRHETAQNKTRSSKQTILLKACFVGWDFCCKGMFVCVVFFFHVPLFVCLHWLTVIQAGIQRTFPVWPTLSHWAQLFEATQYFFLCHKCSLYGKMWRKSISKVVFPTQESSPGHGVYWAFSTLATGKTNGTLALRLLFLLKNKRNRRYVRPLK